VPAVVALVAWLAAVAVALLVGGVVGYELAGHLRRLRGAVRAAVTDLEPRLRALVPPASHGRHRAPTDPG
jgi:hypothetical protein